MKESIAALMPTYDDAYAMFLGAQAIAPYVDEVWIWDDASEDETEDVLDFLQMKFGNIFYIISDTQLGWVEHRLQLLEATGARHVIMMDSDLVIYEDCGQEIKKIVDDPCPHIRMGVVEFTGDFEHTTGRGVRGPKFDLHPYYVDRENVNNIEYWMGKYEYSKIECESHKSWKKRMFAHLKTMKSDWRMVARSVVSEWRRQNCPEGNLHKWMDVEGIDVHTEAMKYVLYDKNNPLRKKPDNISVPEICLPYPRFEIVYTDGRPSDRIDHGWNWQ